MIDYLAWLYADFPTRWDLLIGCLFVSAVFASAAYRHLTWRS